MTGPGQRDRLRSPSGTAALGLLVTLGAAALAAGLSLMLQQPRISMADAGTVPSATTATNQSVDQPVVEGPELSAVAPAPLLLARRPPTPEPPAGLRLPGVPQPVDVVPVGVEVSGALDLPADPQVVGWWAAGVPPGAPEGSAVIAGHVDSAERGAGVLKNLVDIPLESVVQVVEADGDALPYRVVARRSFEKTALPSELFRTDGPPQLVLITCGGAFDEQRGHYSHNLVVYAVPEA